MRSVPLCKVSVQSKTGSEQVGIHKGSKSTMSRLKPTYSPKVVDNKYSESCWDARLNGGWWQATWQRSEVRRARQQNQSDIKKVTQRDVRITETALRFVSVQRAVVFLIIAGSFIPVLAPLWSSPGSFRDVCLLSGTRRCTAFVAATASSSIGGTGCGRGISRWCRSLCLRFVAVPVQTTFIQVPVFR